MKIKFVNHSSFIIEHNGVSIISDPWLEGKVFNNGWDLISKTKLSYEDFKHINYIWFSHEHPDHFYPPNLKLIPLEYKKNITVLFQNTIDGRVANYCRNAGFKDVIELHKGKYYELSKDFKILCEYFGEGDSWIAYKVGDITILNTNDCGIRNKLGAEYIKNSVGKVDILLTQFSYAYWAGNKDEITYRKRIADEKLEYMKYQVDIFEPTITIPIASYIYFCHEENFYLNDSVNTAEKTYNYLKNNTKTVPVVLYNGDEYAFPEQW
ncbi:MAG TPA: MBL fold metallo-hydrolase, partial [Ferruginibacter sp.]|nr:MBL fold metallo-hydrolase [Ferruginibacter sp.]